MTNLVMPSLGLSRLTHRAFLFASAAHGATGQVRRYTGEPYISHPIEVYNIVRSVSHTREMLAAALLHDVVEDTSITLADIEAHFGRGVGALVRQLTDISKPEDGNRAFRKAIDRDHILQASTCAKTIKLADMIDNTRSIVRHDPDFARVYLAEMKLLLRALFGADTVLWRTAHRLVYDWSQHFELN